MEKYHLNRGKMIRGLVVSLIIGISAFVLILLFTIDEDTVKSLQYLNQKYILFSLGIMLLTGVVEGLRIQVVTKAIEEEIGIGQSIKIFYISFFLGGITPYFSAAIPSQVFLFTKQGIPVGKATMVATIRPIMKSVIFLILTPVLFFYFRESLEAYAVLSLLLLLAAVLFSLFFIFIFALAVKNPQKLEYLLEWLRKIPFLRKYLDNPGIKRKMENFMSEVMSFHHSFSLFWGHPKETVLAIGYTLIYWFLYFSIAPLLLIGMGIKLNYALVMVIQVLIFFLLPFIPTPGGSGAAELGFASLFSFFVPSYLLGIYVGGWRLFTFYLNMIIGALLSLNLLREWMGKESKTDL